MGKRGPKADPEKQGAHHSFYANKKCNDGIKQLRQEGEPVHKVLCMTVELATRFPDEFQKIREERAKPESAA